MKKKVVNIYIISLFLLAIELTLLIIYHISYKSVLHIDVDKNYIKEERKPVQANKISLFMVGDALIHSAVYADASVGDNKYDFTSMLSEFSWVSNYDLAFYNQETILGGSELGLSTYPCFNSPYEVGDAFVETGFNLVSLANNHTLDRGEQAILNSNLYWLNKKYVVTSGSYSSWDSRNDIPIYEKNGIKYVFLAYTDSTNGISIPSGKEYLVNVYSEEQVKKDIDSIRDKTDVIIVSMHWGEEYSFSITDRQRQMATYLSNLGVNIIIGEHPHVVEPIDYIGNTLVIYSLGNFLSAQRGIDLLTGLMVSLDIIKDNSGISLENIKAGLTYTSSDTINGYRKNFKVYPYQNLNDSILLDYQMYYNKYMNIVLSMQPDIERW